MSKLEEIWNIFTESSILSTPIRKEKLSLAIEKDGFIKKLLDLFHMCEDLENIEGLHHLYNIGKGTSSMSSDCS
jgi:protein phosphatase-4 regulatory subunit 3